MIAANDANAVVPYLKKAMSQGIKVVTFDSDTAPEGRQIVRQPGRTRKASAAARFNCVVEADRRRGRVRDAFRHAERDQPEHLDQVDAGGARRSLSTRRFQAREDRLRQRRRPEVVRRDAGVAAGVSEPEGDRRADHGRALPRRRVYPRRRRAKGKVAVTGLGTPNQMRAFVKNGTVKAFQLWDPDQLGYLAGFAAASARRRARSAARKGGIVRCAASSASAPSARKAKIILGPPTTFDARDGAGDVLGA